MQNNNSPKYVSDETGAIITSKWVFSVAPKVVSTTGMEPLHCLNQDKTAMQLRLCNIGSERLVFNLSWPQFSTLGNAVDHAQTIATQEKNRQVQPFFWDIADACGEGFLRIFGDPDPTDGLSQVRKLVIRRQLYMKDKSGEAVYQNSPWYVCLECGKGKKLMSKTGGYYMQPNSYKKLNSASAKLSDGSMKQLIYWGSTLMDIFRASMQKSVVERYSSLQEMKQQAVTSRTGSQG